MLFSYCASDGKIVQTEFSIGLLKLFYELF